MAIVAHRPPAGIGPSA